MKMKGMSLPLETVIMLILAAVVLAALLGFFLGAFSPAQSEADLIRQQTLLCQQISNANCDPADPQIAPAVNNLVNNVCRPERPACQKPTDPTADFATACIKSCCKAFCP